MKSTLIRAPLMVLCALLVIGVCVVLAGCSMPFRSTTPDTSAAVGVNQAIYQLQATLGLPDGAVSKSTQAPMLVNTNIPLLWVGGRADVDPQTGRIRAILMDPPDEGGDMSTTTTGGLGKTPALTDAELRAEAERVLALLGWDAAALQANGFTEGEAKTVAYPMVATAYERTWRGHDLEGVLNNGLLQIDLDAANGALRGFLFSPGPNTPLDMSKTITKDLAIMTAKLAAAESTVLTVSATTRTPAAMSTPATSISTDAESATMLHTDDPGITGGKDMLVWVVKLQADQANGRMSALVYVDAVANKTLLVMAA